MLNYDDKSVDGDAEEVYSEIILEDSDLDESDRLLQMMILRNFMGRQKVNRVS